MLTNNFFNQLTKRVKSPIKLWYPQGAKIKFANSDEWERQHDATSTTVRRTIFSLVIFCFFCFLTLREPDIKLLDANATVTVPFAQLPISFVVFLIIGPLILIALSIYLQIFYSYLAFLNTCKMGESKALPYIFNLNKFVPNFISNILIYWLAPATLLFFTWKALPRPEGKILLLLTSIFTVSQLFCKIRRYQSEKRSSLLYRLDWLLLLAILFYSISLFLFPNFLPNRRLIFFGENLSGMDLRRTNLQEADLRNCNLSNSKLEETNLSKADLSEADLSGASLSRADFSGANLSRAVLANFDLKYTDFSEANLEWADLSKAKLSGANLSRAKLSGATLTKADLTRADLTGADLTGADLTKATLAHAQFTDADLTGAIFREADLFEANLMKSILKNAILTNANLVGTNISKAFLSGANLNGANLDHAILDRADLTNAILTNADVTMTKLTNVNGLKEEQLIKACYYEEFGAPKFSADVNFKLPPACRDTE